MSSVNSDDEQPQRWVPTHVQVTVLRGRGLRGKGKNGTSDVYTIIQVGKEKYSTCVVEKTTSPEWKEECSFELLPGVLEEGGRGAYPPGSCDLVLTVMHRALIGLDVFLGQAVIPLDKAFQDHIYAKTEAEWVNLRSRWFRLNSKTGKKEKERGEVQATVQFTRNNLTASMYNLAMKDKGHSAFSKLKERMRGKKRSSVDDDAPAPTPPPSVGGGGGGGGGGSLPRTRLPSDGGGEEEYEDDEGGEGRRNKMRTFFLRGKLRKSSETRSSTSLGSESSESSSRGGSLSPTAGISVVVSDLSNSPSNSSNLTADNSPEHTADTSPKLSPDDSEFGDDCHEISIAVPALYRNGGVHHAYHAPPPQPGPGEPLAPAAAAVAAAAKASPLGLGLHLKPLPTSVSLQNISPREEELPRGAGGAGDGRRWSFDKPGEDEKAAIAAALEKSGPMVGDDEEEERSRSAAPPPGATGAARESYDRKQQQQQQQKKKKGDSGGRVGSEAAPQEKTGKGWFGSKECNSKPSPRVSPKLGPIPESHSPPLPSVPPPSQHPSWCSWAPPAPPGSTPPGSPLHPTNPFCHSQCSPPPTPMSPSNPFFSTLQQNPSSGAALSDPPLTSRPPPLPYLSSARPPIAHLFSQDPDPVPGLLRERPSPKGRTFGASDATAGGEALARLKRRPLPHPPPGEEEEASNGRSPNPFNSVGTAAPELEWDDPFEAFVSCRLQSSDDEPAGPPDPKNAPAQNSPKGSLVEFWHPDKEEPPKSPDPLKDSDVVQAFPPQPADVFLDTAPEPWSDGFAQFPTAIPATNQNAGMLLTTSLDSSENHDGDTVTNLANPSSNTDCLTRTTTPGALCQHCRCEHNPSIPCEGETLKDRSDSSDPSSSGVGSLAEEDALSSISCSASEKWAACWGEGVETKSVLDLSEESPEQTVLGLLKDSEDKLIDWSCPVVTDHRVEGDLIQVSDPNEKPRSMVDDLVADDQVLVPPPLISLQHGDGPSKEPGPTHVPLSDLSSKPTNTSIPRDLELEATVSRTGGANELQESFGDLHEPENFVKAADGDDESVTPHPLEIEGTSTCPSFHTVTSFLGDGSSFLEMPFGTGSLDGQLVRQSSPKTPRLLCPKDGPTMTAPLLVFNESSLVESTLGVSDTEEQLVLENAPKPPELLDVIASRASPSPDQAFYDPLPGGRWLCPSPGSLLSSSLHGSADSQHYQTCLTHNSSAATSSASVDSLVERRTSEDLRGSVSTLRGAESCDELSRVLFPENASAPGLEGACGAADVDGEAAEVGMFPSEETCLAKELETCFEPGLGVEDLGSHSDTPIQIAVGSVVNRNHGSDDQPAGGTQQNAGAPSEDTPPAPTKTECPSTLQRSHSEGAMATGLSGRTLTSFGSDPSVVPSLRPTDPSGPPDSAPTPFLLLLLSPTSCLPAGPPAPLARCSLPSASVTASLPLPTATPGPAPEAPPPPEEAHATGVAHASDEPHLKVEKVERPQNSPHPVRPLTPGSQGPEERRGPEGRSVLEKLRCTIQPGRSSQLSEAEPERRKSLTEGAGSYYHLTHSELVALLVGREADLERQKAEFERQTALLSRREVELRRLKPQVRDLENYIDTLLVRIMEQTPTLLQVGTTKFK
ncbi:unnamed protein product [Gadus morhua 'NCC']